MPLAIEDYSTQSSTGLIDYLPNNFSKIFFKYLVKRIVDCFILKHFAACLCL